MELFSNQWLMGILLGKNDLFNPRENTYYEGRDAVDGRNGLLQSGVGSPMLVDPWGRLYRVILSNDGMVTTPDGKRIEGSVAVYSVGEDGYFDDEDPKSWQ